MGVNQHNYIIVGADIGNQVSINYDEDDAAYEKYEKYSDSYRNQKQPGDIIFLDDCYSGNYLYVGEVLQGDYEGYNGFSPFEVDTNNDKHKESQERVKKFVLDEFGIEVEPKIIVLTHYT